MDSGNNSSNKIMDVVRLRQMLKRWKKRSSKNSIKLLKKTFSFSETSSSSSSSSDPHCGVPKGCFAVCVGEEMKRFVVPMEYLGHRAFHLLLREAEEEFGFQNEGVLRIPCQVSVFEGVLEKLVEEKKKKSAGLRRHCSSEAGRNQLHHLRGEMYG